MTAVYVVDGKRISLRQIRAGAVAADGAVEVLAGLNPGEQVALDPVKVGMMLSSSK